MEYLFLLKEVFLIPSAVIPAVIIGVCVGVITYFGLRWEARKEEKEEKLEFYRQNVTSA